MLPPAIGKGHTGQKSVLFFVLYAPFEVFAEVLGAVALIPSPALTRRIDLTEYGSHR